MKLLQHPLMITSRPKLWVYLFGTYLLGIVFSTHITNTPLLQWVYVAVFALYFTFPANYLLYGVSSIFDPSAKLSDIQRRNIWKTIFLSNTPFLILLLFTLNIPAITGVWLFIFCAVFYSAPPLRAQSRFLLGGLFSCLYVFPGFIAAALLGAESINLPVVLAGSAWCLALRAFSLIPTITVTKKAGRRNIATILGVRGTFIYCIILYSLAALLTLPWLGEVPLLFITLPGYLLYGLIYIGYMSLGLYISNPQRLHHAGPNIEKRIAALYEGFPTLTTLVLISLFTTTLLSLFPNLAPF